MPSEPAAATGASRVLRQLEPGRDAVHGVAARGLVLRRRLTDGAVAGTVVGVVIGVGLLAFCLYPVVVYYVKRRRRVKRALLDPEAARLGSPRCADLARRLSSSDSFKHNGDACRGANGHPGKEHDGDEGARGVDFASNGLRPSTGPDAAALHHSHDASQPPAFDAGPQPPPSPLPFYYGEYMPESEVCDDNPGVLKGTSADYYSPSIPSSAFGMVTTPPDVSADAPRASPRTSSLRYNVRHMFRRKSSGDPAGASELYGATAQQVATAERPAESPTELSPATALPAAPAPTPTPFAASSAKHRSTSPQLPANSPPQPQCPERSLKASPSPPSFPAPGTVNPMDIMPACTESEVWHRTEHRLLASTHGWPQVASPPPEQRYQSMDYAPVASSPLPPAAAQAQPMQTAQSPTPTDSRENVDEEQARVHDVAMANAHPNGLSPSTMAEASRHPSFPSDQSTSFRGPGSTTDPSSHNTPSSQMDSPTPESMNSSDFRHSVSPQPGAPSLKSGQFTCDEPGCHQSFDQPHKLKHHQRYHSRDHKCPYANCGKGFGTKTHLQRHINDRHEKKKKFHCSVPGCDYSRAGGKAFPRKDNWKRHMTKIHNMDQTQLPEPVEVDHDMGEV